MTCSMPAAAIRDSRWVRNGRPAVGSIGLGADRVSGRSRVPLPPTRITASTSGRGSTVDSAVGLISSALLGQFAAGLAHRRARPRPQRALHRPPQRRLPPADVAIGQVDIGAVVVGAQVAGGLPAGRVALVVQDLRTGNVDVEPARPAQPVTEVDVLHVHEVALVESADLRRTPCGGPAGRTPTASRPARSLGSTCSWR